MQYRIVVLCALFLALSGRARADPINWTDWTSAAVGAGGSAQGVVTRNSTLISVDYSGEVTPNSQTSGGINYWLPSSPYMSPTIDNGPPCCDIITLVGGSTLTNTLTFSAPLTNPVLAIASLGRASRPVRYLFNEPFQVLSSGPGFWGGPGTLTGSGNVLTGIEGHGAIQFQGTFSSLSWNAPDAEFWHGFTLGVSDAAAVPEPMTLMLTGFGVAVAAWRRRSRMASRESLE